MRYNGSVQLSLESLAARDSFGPDLQIFIPRGMLAYAATRESHVAFDLLCFAKDASVIVFKYEAAGIVSIVVVQFDATRSFVASSALLELEAQDLWILDPFQSLHRLHYIMRATGDAIAAHNTAQLEKAAA